MRSILTETSNIYCNVSLQFSTLDICSGFYQISVDPESHEKTVFVTKYGIYQYNRLPMGLCNSPATFQRLVDIVFAGLIRECTVAYVDDLNIYSNDLRNHFRHLRQVFNRIRLAGLLLNPEKCEFFKTSISFLGYVVSADGIKTDPVKIEKVAKFPKPKMTKEL